MPFSIFLLPGIICFVWGIFNGMKAYKNAKQTNSGV